MARHADVLQQLEAGTLAPMMQELGVELIRQQEEVQIEGARDVALRWLLARKPGY